MSFERNMAIWEKGRGYDKQTDMIEGDIIVTPKINDKIYATINPERREVYYHQDFAEPCISSYIPVDDLKDLQYFVSLLMEDD